MVDDFIIFAGTVNRSLAGKIAAEVGAQLGNCSIERFPDGELPVKLDESARGREVPIVFVDACRREGGGFGSGINFWNTDRPR